MSASLPPHALSYYDDARYEAAHQRYRQQQQQAMSSHYGNLAPPLSSRSSASSASRATSYSVSQQGGALPHSRSTPAGLSQAALHAQHQQQDQQYQYQHYSLPPQALRSSPDLDPAFFSRQPSPPRPSDSGLLSQSSAPAELGSIYRVSPPSLGGVLRPLHPQQHLQAVQQRATSAGHPPGASSLSSFRRQASAHQSAALHASHPSRLQSHPYYRPPQAARPQVRFAQQHQGMAGAEVGEVQSRPMSQPLAPASSYLMPRSYSPQPRGAPLSFAQYDDERRQPSVSPSYDALPAAVNAIHIDAQRADDALFHQPHAQSHMRPPAPPRPGLPSSEPYRRAHPDIDLTQSPLPLSPPSLQPQLMPMPSPPPQAHHAAAPPRVPAQSQVAAVAPSNPPSPPSTISSSELGDRYTLLDYLGSGSYGHVHLAQHRPDNTTVAIKKIIHIFDNLTNAKRLLREIKILRMLRHENVIRFYHLLPPAAPLRSFNDLAIVFEFVDTDLQKLIHSNQHFSNLHIQYFMYQLCCGIAYVHSASIIHRDLKPANVLVNADCSLRICDFGLARMSRDGGAGGAGLTGGGGGGGGEQGAPNGTGPMQSSPYDPLPLRPKRGLIGSAHPSSSITLPAPPSRMKRELTKHVVTRWYRAPELILLSEHYTTAIDMWSIGCILAELLSMQAESHTSPEDRQALFPGRSCFAEHDTRMLTDQGFLFLAQIEALEATGQQPLYACYDTASSTIMYRPGTVVLSSPPQRWVDFTQSATRRHWDASGDADYDANDPAAGELANFLTLRATPEHLMYVQPCTTKRAPVPRGKMAAVELAPGFVCSCKSSLRCPHGRCTYRVFTAAAAGICSPADIMSIADSEDASPVIALRLGSDDELCAFLELYGCWLRDGTISYDDHSVQFVSRKECDWHYLLGLLERLHLREGEGRRRELPGRRLSITAACWFKYFDEHYGLKYEDSQYYNREAAIIKLGLPDVHEEDEEATQVELAHPDHLSKLAQWFLPWVMKRLSRVQLRLILKGLCEPDGWQGVRTVATSSVVFREQLMQVCLHAGYSAHFAINRRAGDVLGYNTVPSDRCLYSDEEVRELLVIEPPREFTPIRSRYDRWWVRYSLATSELLPAQDVRFDGKPPRLRAMQKDGEAPAAEQLRMERPASASSSTPLADVYDEQRDGRVWCVQVQHVDHLIFVQRAHRSPTSGLVTKAGRALICGNCFPLSADHPMAYADQLDQLNVIFDVIGTPSPEDLSQVDNDTARGYIGGLKKKPPVNLYERYASADPMAVDLLSKLLVFHPGKRYTASQCLAHPFFDAVRDELVGLRYRERAPVDFNFEDKTLSREQIRSLIVEEILVDNPHLADQQLFMLPMVPSEARGGGNLSTAEQQADARGDDQQWRSRV